MRIVIVEWEDAVAAKDNLGSWLHKDEFDAWCGEPIARPKSVGYMTFECDEFIVISQSILGDDVAESTKIPRINIVKMILVDEDDFDRVGIKYVRGETQELVAHTWST